MATLQVQVDGFIIDAVHTARQVEREFFVPANEAIARYRGEAIAYLRNVDWAAVADEVRCRALIALDIAWDVLCIVCTAVAFIVSVVRNYDPFIASDMAREIVLNELQRNQLLTEADQEIAASVERLNTTDVIEVATDEAIEAEQPSIVTELNALTLVDIDTLSRFATAWNYLYGGQVQAA